MVSKDIKNESREFGRCYLPNLLDCLDPKGFQKPLGSVVEHLILQRPVAKFNTHPNFATACGKKAEFLFVDIREVALFSNPIEFDGIRKSEMVSRKLPTPIRDPKGFWKPLGSSAEEQEAGR